MPDDSTWTGPLSRTLDELTAFDAMRAFIEAYWEVGGKQEEQITNLLSAMNRGVWVGGAPADIAMWHDWLNAVARIRRTPYAPDHDPLG